MRKKFLAVMMALSMATTGSIPAMAESGDHNFDFTVKTETDGYDSAAVNKKAGNSKARVYVSSTTKSSFPWTSVSMRTNFIVCASDSTQITYAGEAAKGETCYLNYYSSQHSGAVHLRANSTGTGVGYTVKGTWNPNY